MARCRPLLRGKLAFTAMALSLSSAGYGAQDLLQTWQMALARDPAYAAAQAQYRAVQQAVPQARAALLPWLTAGAQATQRDERAAATLSRDGSHQRAAWSLTLTQPLFNRTAWRELAQSHLIAADATIALTIAQQDAMLRSTQAYFDVLAAQDALTTIEAEQASIAAQWAAARRNFELGNATIVDTYEAQSRHDLITADALQAQNNLDVAIDALSKLLGAPPEPLAALPQELSLPALVPNRLESWIKQAQSAALTVQRTQLGLQMAEQNIEIARSGHAPTLELRASAGSASDLNRPAPQSGRGLENTVGLYLNIPIYSGGLISSRVSERVALAQKARYDHDAARRSAVQDARRYFTGVNTGLARISALQAAETSSRASVAANRTGYEIGVRDSLNVLDAQRQLYLTRRELARARYDTLMAGLRLRAITGILSEQDLQAINRLLRAPDSAIE